MGPKKNILIFFWYYSPPGGAELFVEQITKLLGAHYNFAIITAKFKKALPSQERAGEVLIYRVGLGCVFIDKYFYPIFALWQAYKVRRKKKISLIHGVIANPAGFATMLFHQLTKTPFLLTEQSGNLDRKVRRLNPIIFWIYKKIYQEANFIQVISNSLKQTILSLGGIDENKIEVIPNGIDLATFKFESPRQKEKYRIICLARLEKYKGIRYLVEAMPQVLEKFPQAKLVLIGEGPERKNLEAKIKELKIEEKVELKGELPHEKIPEELAQSHVFVGPSLEEGMGVVFIEAQAAGIPVIGTNIGGIPDIIENEKTGLLIKPKDSQAIAQAITKIFSQPELAQNLVENAKVNLKKYDWQNISQKVFRIYQRIIL